jgi:hypothetical protein
MKVAIEDTKVGFPPISVRQPQLHDLVDDPVKVCGIATGFEGRISARVRDGSGAEVAETSIGAGGTGTWGNFQVEIALGVSPATPQGTLELFDTGGAGGEIEFNKVSRDTLASNSTRCKTAIPCGPLPIVSTEMRICGLACSKPTEIRSSTRT